MRTKKSLLIVTAGAVLAVVAGLLAWLLPDEDPTVARVIGADSAAVIRAEEARAVVGAQTVDMTLTAAPATVDVGGRTVATWAFNGSGTSCVPAW